MRFSMTSIMILTAALGVNAAPASAAVFALAFAFPSAGIADIPGSTELASNQFIAANVTVGPPTQLSLFRLRQSNSAGLLGNIVPPGTDVDLALGGNRFEVKDQTLDPAGQLVATFTYSGGFLNSLGYAFEDGGEQLFLYADLPFRLYVDASATYDGIGPFTGSADVVYFALPGNEGLYRLQAAVPEPASWAMMIAGFALAGAALRSRQRVAIA